MFLCLGKGTVKVIDHHFCRFLQSHGPAVVAETLPNVKNLSQGSLGEGGEVGKCSKKFPVLFDGPLNPRLLEHDLGNQDMVGVFGFMPGKGGGGGMVVGIDLGTKPLYSLPAQVCLNGFSLDFVCLFMVDRILSDCFRRETVSCHYGVVSLQREQELTWVNSFSCPVTLIMLVN